MNDLPTMRFQCKTPAVQTIRITQGNLQKIAEEFEFGMCHGDGIYNEYGRCIASVGDWVAFSNEDVYVHSNEEFHSIYQPEPVIDREKIILAKNDRFTKIMAILRPALAEASPHFRDAVGYLSAETARKINDLFD